MSVDTNTSVGGRVISAFFDTRDHAARAIDDLVAAGIPRQHISRADSADDQDATSPAAHRGFWETLQGFFLPDADRHAYAEGLRRGGTLITVHTEEGNYIRVFDILDTDGAVDMDERERHWQAEGWAHHPAYRDADRAADRRAVSPADSTTPSGEANASPAAIDATTDTNWRTDGAARAAALDGAVPEAARAAQAVRDSTMARPRIRSYRFGGNDTAERTRQTGTFSPEADAARIVPHMVVFSSDGQTIGTVDHLDGPDRIKLAKSTSPDGEHHFVPFTWIDHVDQHVHLRKTLAEIKAPQVSSVSR